MYIAGFIVCEWTVARSGLCRVPMVRDRDKMGLLKFLVKGNKLTDFIWDTILFGTAENQS